MDQRYIQPFANPQLNSCQQAELKASGQLGWKLDFNPEDLGGGTQFIYVLDESRALVDFDGILFALDLQSMKTIGAPLKSPGTFIQLGEEQLFHVFSTWQLVPLEFDRIKSDRLGMEENESESEDEEPEEEDKPSRSRYYVPGLGEYSALACLFVDTAGFIAGVQSSGTPEYPDPRFSIFEMEFGGVEKKWGRVYEGDIIRPPISPQGQAVVARLDGVSIFSREGAVKNEIEGEFESLSCSIGPNNLIYLVCRDEDGVKLRIYNLWGELESEIGDITGELTQPPVISSDGRVYLVGPGKIEVFHDGAKSWTYPLLSSAAMATVSGEGQLLVADGARIVCLDSDGAEVWTFEDSDGDIYITPPIIDGQGRVLVASNDNILMIK